MKKNLGFTLIELLVVISIITILVSLSLVSLGGAQKQGRDTKRRSDLDQYRNALEQYAASNSGKYPGFAAATVVQMSAGDNLCTATYLYPFTSNTCLIDPNPSGACADSSRNYCYYENGSTDGATATEYVLYTGLETGGYWEVCSIGKVGKVSAAALPGDSACDL